MCFYSSLVGSDHVCSCAEFRCDATDLVTSSFGQVEVTGVPGATYPVGAVATFSCSSGDLSGGAVRTCLVGGWNGENPVCGEYFAWLFEWARKLCMVRDCMVTNPGTLYRVACIMWPIDHEGFACLINRASNH